MIIVFSFLKDKEKVLRQYIEKRKALYRNEQERAVTREETGRDELGMSQNEIGDTSSERLSTYVMISQAGL